MSNTLKPEDEFENYFLKINYKNSFSIYSNNDIKIIQNNIFALSRDLNQNNLVNIGNEIFQKTLPVLEKNIFKTSLDSFYYYKRYENLDYNICEKSIKYFLIEKKEDLIIDKIIIFDNNLIYHLGRLILFSYSLLTMHRIYNEMDLKTEKKKTKDEQINVKEDYIQDCNRNNVEPGENFKFWKKNEKNYKIPPYIIFLNNIFKNTQKIIIDFDIDENFYVNPTNYLLYFICLTNLNFCFNFKKIKINFIHKNLLTQIYRLYLEIINSYEEKYNSKITYINLEKNEMFHKNYKIKNNYLFLNKININLSKILKSKNIFSDLNNNSLQNFEVLNENQTYQEIMKKYMPIIQNIILTFFTITRYRNDLHNLSIKINDCFYNEILYALTKIYKFKIKNNFHILDNFLNFVSLTDLSIEFNSLDFFTFEKIIKLIYLNEKLINLKISLFSPEINYQPSGLYKIYQEIKYSNNGKDFLTKIEKLFSNKFENPFDNIVNDFLFYFEENINFLFFLIKDKKLKHLKLKLIMPKILNSNDFYKTILQKFIINLLLLNNNKNSSMESLKIYSPYISFDSKVFININEIFEYMNFEQNNKILNELIFQAKFYKINFIHKIISTNLTNLIIGDCDEFTFEKLTNFISNENFYLKSKLKNLSIGLLPIITDIKDIFNSFFNLFNTHFSDLESINIYTNIKFERSSYKKLLEILDNHWIKSITFTFNVNCELMAENLNNNFNLGYFNHKNDKEKHLYNLIRIIAYKKLKEINNTNINNEYILMNIEKFLFKKKSVVFKNKISLDNKI